jgi:16S rRNA (cytidine1402-2'-O)-methyltransferase
MKQESATGHQFLLEGHVFKGLRPPPGLSIVSTPIGHLKDITLRGLETLAAVDVILAEDTRVTRPLLTHYGIHTRLVAFHEHNSAAQTAKVIERLEAGDRLALVSDAGTPILSDPGRDLVSAVIAAGHAVIPVPGASALLAGLVGIDLGAGDILFAGFLPAKRNERRQRLRLLGSSEAVLVFYEAPHRLVETLEDALAILGDRPATVARELTKRFETFNRQPLSALLAHYKAEEPRGEIVLFIGPAQGQAALDGNDVDARLLKAFEDLSIKDAAQVVGAELGLPRRQVYARAIELKARMAKA